MAAISGFSDYYENKVLDHMVRGEAFTVPVAVYVALFTTIPDEDGTGGVEVTGNGYARQAATFAAAANGSVTTSTDITFPVATPAGWGTVTSFGIYDALTDGNLLMGDTLSESKVVTANDQLKFLAGQLTVSIS